MPIAISCLDGQATHYGTFQSHNQKVVSNRRGIFTTHIRSRDRAYRAQTWRLSRSADGGRTFETLFEATHATNPPALETDEDDAIYAGRVDFLDWHARLYRFDARLGYRDPRVTLIPFATGDKYAMLLDRARDQLCWYPRTRSFHTVGRDGRIRRSNYGLFKYGPIADLQYPHLVPGGDGTLHAAWTSNRNGRYLYWDIHHMVSRDGGETWWNLDGSPLPPPIVTDHTGPAMRITPDDEFEVHTWLASFLVKAGKAHFVYRADTNPPRMHYMRYDVATGVRDVHHCPEFRGGAIALDGFDGFLASRLSEPESPLYCVMGCAGGRIGCLVSRDNGATWRDHAVTDGCYSPYSVGGCREVMDDGSVIGTFTDQLPPANDSMAGGRVMFLRISPA